MQQDPLVLFIDLPTEAQSFRSTLASQGLKVASITLEEAATGISQLQPRVVLAPLDRAAAVATLIAKASAVLEIPFFTLSKSGPSVQATPPRGVTAVLPHDIDPGVLCLRLATVLSQPQSRRVSQATLVGVGIGSSPPPASGAGPFSSSAPTSAPPVPPGSTSSGSRPQSSESVKTSAPEPEASTENAPGSEASTPTTEAAPPAASSSASSQPDSPVSGAVRGYKGAAIQSVPTSKARSGTPGAFTSSASSPSASSPSASSPSASSPSASSPSSASVASGAPASAADAEEAVRAPDAVAVTPSAAVASGEGVTAPPSPSRSERPVTLSSPLPLGVDADAEVVAMVQSQAAAKSKRVKIAAVFGLFLVVGAGSAFALGGADKEVKLAAHTLDASSAESMKPKAEPAPDQKPTEPEKAVEPVEVKEPVDPEVALFKIKSEKSLSSCEEVLGNPRAHYEKMAPWKGASAWKLARRAMMKGDNEEAQKRMCESAFIDSQGAATLGLARYYLSVRALDEAEKWARLGIEVSPKAKRAAKELLGDVLCQRGKMNEAREIWLESFDLTADQKSRLEAVSRRFLSAAAKVRRGGDAALAERHLRRVAAFDLENSDVAADLASILVKTDEPDLARAWADKALALDPSSKVAKGVLSELNK